MFTVICIYSLCDSSILNFEVCSPGIASLGLILYTVLLFDSYYLIFLSIYLTFYLLLLEKNVSFSTNWRRKGYLILKLCVGSCRIFCAESSNFSICWIFKTTWILKEHFVVDDSVECFKLICGLLIQCWMFLLFVIWKSSSFDDASIY